MRERALELHSDGCTQFPFFSKDDLAPCQEHDVHYRLHKTIFGKSITRQEADTRFWLALADRSPLGRVSPLAWGLWLAARALGQGAWKEATSLPRFKKPGDSSDNSSPPEKPSSPMGKH